MRILDLSYSACRESFVERSILERLSDTRRKRLRCASDSIIRQSTFDIRHSNVVSKEVTGNRASEN